MMVYNVLHNPSMSFNEYGGFPPAGWFIMDNPSINGHIVVANLGPRGSCLRLLRWKASGSQRSLWGQPRAMPAIPAIPSGPNGFQSGRHEACSSANQSGPQMLRAPGIWAHRLMCPTLGELMGQRSSNPDILTYFRSLPHPLPFNQRENHTYQTLSNLKTSSKHLKTMFLWWIKDIYDQLPSDKLT